MILIIFIGIVLVFISFLAPFAGLINYLGILYLRPMEVVPSLISYPIAKIFAIATLLGFVLNDYGKKDKLFFNFKQDKLLFGFLAVIILSFSVGWIPKCLEVLDQMAKNVVVYALIVGMVRSEKRLKILIWALLIMSGILAFDTFQKFQTVNTGHLDVGRLGGFASSYFGDANDFGVMMNIVIPFAFLFGVFGRSIKLRLFSLLLMALFVSAIVAARTRGGLLTFAVIILGLGYFGLKASKGWQRFISITLVVATIAAMAIFSPKVFKERSGTILNYKNQYTANERIENWKLGIKMFLSNPLIGVGAGNYLIRYQDFGGSNAIWMVSHNMYIDVLSELGILGFSFFFFLLYYTFKGGRDTLKMLAAKKEKDSFIYVANQGTILSLIGYCVGGMFLSILTYPMLYIIIALNVAAQNIAFSTVTKAKDKRNTRKIVSNNIE